MPASVPLTAASLKASIVSTPRAPVCAAFGGQVATLSFCSEKTRIPMRNFQFYQKSKCISAVRLCRICVEKGYLKTENPDDPLSSPFVDDSESGLCKYHRQFGSDASRDRTPLGVITTGPIREVDDVYVEPGSGLAVAGTAAKSADTSKRSKPEKPAELVLPPGWEAIVAHAASKVPELRPREREMFELAVRFAPLENRFEYKRIADHASATREGVRPSTANVTSLLYQAKSRLGLYALQGPQRNELQLRAMAEAMALAAERAKTSPAEDAADVPQEWKPVGWDAAVDALVPHVTQLKGVRLDAVKVLADGIYDAKSVRERLGTTLNSTNQVLYRLASELRVPAFGIADVRERAHIQRRALGEAYKRSQVD